MGKTILYILVAYLSGSVLYANVFGELFGVRDKYAEKPDKNPGAANAYSCGGFWCGTLTLIFDFAKGAAPVYFFTRTAGVASWGLPLMLAAPVAGHIFPIFYGFHGGKGIAATFGALAGLLPDLLPVLLFAVSFIFLSVIVKVSPHYYRTIAAYLMTLGLMPVRHVPSGIFVGFLMITALVCAKLALSREEKSKFEVKLLWTR